MANQITIGDLFSMTAGFTYDMNTAGFERARQLTGDPFPNFLKTTLYFTIEFYHGKGLKKDFWCIIRLRKGLSQQPLSVTLTIQSYLINTQPEPV